MKSKLIVANWKQNPDSLETAKKLLQISESFHEQEKSAQHIVITHAVPYIFAGILKAENKKENIILQNISTFNGGSHTGEISAVQAKKLGFDMSIVGHSETRLSPSNPRGDEDKEVNQKLKNLLKENMWVILCIGEYERENKENIYDWKSFLETQIENCLKDITPESLQKIIFAYEPVWAIGEHAKRAATTEEIIEAISFIKKNFLDIHNSEEGPKILYGGSVDETNANEILNLENIDGLLIGRASSDPAKWQKLLTSLF